MKTIVNFCGNCPFLYSNYDDYSTGFSTIDECNLARFLQLETYTISIHNNMGYDENAKTPEWCPLKKEACTFSFQEFAPEKAVEIESIKKEIEKLNEFFDTLTGENYSIEIVGEKTDELRDLYEKLSELQSNQETVNSEFGTEEFQSQIDEVKEKLSILEDAGNKLQALINNLEEE
jgi:hypothetical protein